MASVINASSSGAGGLVSSGDSSGVLQLQNNGSTSVTLDTSGNVGIGTASPSYKLDVSLASSTSGIVARFNSPSYDELDFYVGSSKAYIGTASGTPLAFQTNNAERMRIDSSGQAIIGSTSVGRGDKLTVVGAGTLSTVTSSVRGLLAVESDTATAQNVGGAISLGGNYDSGRTQYAAIGGFKESTTSSEYGGYLALFTRPNGDLTKERMRIDSSGNLLVGTTTFQGRFTVTATGSTTIDCARTETSNANQIVFRNGNGAVGSITTNGSVTSYNTSSDYRLKDNIEPMTGALNTVAQLKPVTYKWKIDGSASQGFIAHELQAVVPECVSGEKDATREEEYEVTPAVKDEQGNITTPAVMGTRTVPSYQGIDTSFLVATLTAALQETKALIDTQAETINALTARIVALERQ